ncbi:hypothetical protein BI49514_02390 [Brevibacterium iodinum ATCC 49514]|uniref:Uncharacterized protein n=1 Tax=Brevibacterium iodinum ATCC 49514 TaxID=1255616 RepID=A0A2H1JV18_9MICO|nr:hypothetical protein [Brevibacterium iodinum]SMX91340.1 hypothetical protein BI49514_02390 [Brevibacterium iodinum ATCC 49514]SUW70176.1 Uncharacterised protein [Brevibacterium iodinum]
MVDDNEVQPESEEEVDPSDLDALLERVTRPDQVYENTTESYLDPGLMGLAEEPEYPAWLGLRWREIPVELQQEAWVGLRRWVDWLIAEFKINKAVIPGCWFRHSEIVAELHAAMNLEYKTWEEGAPTVNAMWMWLPQLQQMMMRLREQVKELGSCADGQHKEPDPVQRDYDEDLWERTVFTRVETKTVERPGADAEAEYVRVRVVDDNGEIVSESNVGGAGPVRKARGERTSVLTGDGVPGGTDAILTLKTEQFPEAADLIWERSDDEMATWSGLEEKEDENSGENQPPEDEETMGPGDEER